MILDRFFSMSEEFSDPCVKSTVRAIDYSLRRNFIYFILILDFKLNLVRGKVL